MVSNFLPAVVLLDRRRETTPPRRGSSEEELFKEELFMRALFDLDFRTTGVFTLTGVGVSTTSSSKDEARRLSEERGFPERPSILHHHVAVMLIACDKAHDPMPLACDNGVTELVNGRMEEEFRELCKGGAQNATVCKIHSCKIVKVGKKY